MIFTAIPTNLVTNSLLSFFRNQKQKLNFQEVVDLVTINICSYWLSQDTLYLKVMPTWIDFNERILLPVHSVRIIVPWF